MNTTSHGNYALHAVIPSQHVRAFAKILQCLNRIGDELYIEAYPTKLLLSTVNQARSVVAMIHCNARFFDTYQVQSISAYPHSTNGFNHSATSTFHANEDITPHCRIQIKALLSMFRTSSTVDRNVEQVELILEDGQLGHPECRFNVRLYCRHGVIMARHLFYEVGEPLRAIYNKQSCRHHWRVSSKILGDWMTFFQSRLGELTTVCTPTDTKLRSYDESNQNQVLYNTKSVLRTELSVDITEFERYHVESPVELSFSLKEFKVIGQLAENLASPLSAYFEEEGSPMLLCIAHHELITADFIVSTVTDTGASMANMPSQASISEADPADVSILRSVTSSTSMGMSMPTRSSVRVLAHQSSSSIHLTDDQSVNHAHSNVALDVSHSFLRPSYPVTHLNGDNNNNNNNNNNNSDDSVCEDSDQDMASDDEDENESRTRTTTHPTLTASSSSNKKARLLF